MDKNYYSLNGEEVLGSLKTSKNGLTEEESVNRLEKYGNNELKKTKGISPLKIFIRQFTSFITIILLVAIVISLLMGEKLDAIVIDEISMVISRL